VESSPTLGPGGIDAGVVHEDVHCVEGFERRVEESFDLLLVADVGLHDDRPPARRLHRLTGVLRSVFVLEVVDHDVSPLLGELDRGALPDTRVRAGDERHLLLQSSCRHKLCLLG